MSDIQQSEVMPQDTGSDNEQSIDAAEMSEMDLGAMFDAPAEAEESEGEQEDAKEDEVAQEAEEATPVEPEIPAPANWSDADKEEFKALPRAMQEKIVTREKERDAYLTKKTQEIADKSRSVQSLEVLGEALRNDPGFRDYLAAYKRQQAQQEAPSDPIDRIAWEAEQRAVAKVNEQFLPIIQQMQHQSRIQETLSAVKQDEHYKEVYAEIGKMLQTLPPALAKETYQRLDTDPAFFSETYDHIRASVISRPKPEPEVEKKTPQPVDRKTKAPLLEAPGAEQPDVSRKKRFNDLKSSAMSGDTAALGALFDL